MQLSRGRTGVATSAGLHGEHDHIRRNRLVGLGGWDVDSVRKETRVGAWGHRSNGVRMRGWVGWETRWAVGIGAIDVTLSRTMLPGTTSLQCTVTSEPSARSTVVLRQLISRSDRRRWVSSKLRDGSSQTEISVSKS